MTIHLSANRSCPDPVTDSVCLASTDYMNINFGIYDMHGRIFVVVVVVDFDLNPKRKIGSTFYFYIHL